MSFMATSTLLFIATITASAQHLRGGHQPHTISKEDAMMMMRGLQQHQQADGDKQEAVEGAQPFFIPWRSLEERVEQQADDGDKGAQPFFIPWRSLEEEQQQQTDNDKQ